jgi:hypothetical protein
VKRRGELEFFVGRRYGDFSRLHKKLRTELPGKVLPPMPKKNKQSSTTSNLLSAVRRGSDSDASSVSSVSTMGIPPINTSINNLSVRGKSLKFPDLQAILTSPKDHRRSPSSNSFGGRASPRSSIDSRQNLNPSPALTPAPSDEVRKHGVIYRLELS